MAKGGEDQTSVIMPQGPKASTFDGVQTAFVRVDSSYYVNPLSAAVPKAPVAAAAVEIGDDAAGGRLTIRTSDGPERASLRANSSGASLRLSDEAGRPFAYLGSANGFAALALGGDDTLPGRLHVRDGKYQDRATVSATVDGAGVHLWDKSGKTFVYLGDAGGHAELALGGDDTLPGRLLVRDGKYQDRARVAATADGGAVRLLDKYGKTFAYLGDAGGRAELGLGGDNRLSGRIALRDGAYQDQIVLDADSGDILLMNADCAELFDVTDDAEPGTVLVLDGESDALRPCTRSYDSCVAGVLSGAGGYRPGIVLDYHGQGERRRPVALMGKVFCKVEAESGPVRPGSLLTTSEMPGYAMAATDRERAFGCVLGKALRGLASGTGMVPVLVALQ